MQMEVVKQVIIITLKLQAPYHQSELSTAFNILVWTGWALIIQLLSMNLPVQGWSDVDTVLERPPFQQCSNIVSYAAPSMLFALNPNTVSLVIISTNL